MKKTGNKSFLIDTNIIIDLLKGDRKIADNISQADVIYLPIFALAELYFGAEKSSRKNYHLEKIEAFTNLTSVLNTTKDTALIYSNLKLLLKRNGTPIPENDIWIAALALENELPLVSNDKHFKLLPDVRLIKW